MACAKGLDTFGMGHHSMDTIELVVRHVSPFILSDDIRENEECRGKVFGDFSHATAVVHDDKVEEFGVRNALGFAIV